MSSSDMIGCYAAKSFIQVFLGLYRGLYRLASVQCNTDSSVRLGFGTGLLGTGLIGTLGLQNINMTLSIAAYI
jgi:hypothetical protein